MKKLISLCILICICCPLFCSCNATEGKNDSIFVFLSVRMKGNGDGTVTASAQNEFAIGYLILPVTLTLYSSETYQTGVENMTVAGSATSDDLNIFGKLNVVAEVGEHSYFCARVTYAAGGEERYLQSATVQYTGNGERVAG